jgi:acetylornithine deacetylase/succinyl-diaminopimelate desuccinylase-like protein
MAVMSTGAGDGWHLRTAGMPVYGVSGVFSDLDDCRAHGKDERVGVKKFYDGAEFMYRLVKALGQWWHHELARQVKKSQARGCPRRANSVY